MVGARSLVDVGPLVLLDRKGYWIYWRDEVGASKWRNTQRTYGLIDRPNCAGIGPDSTHEQGNLNSAVDVFFSPFLWVQPRVKIERSDIVHIPASTSP